MRIRWTPRAAADLDAIYEYLKEHHPHFIRRTMRQLYEAAFSLKTPPQRGRIGREEGTRELLCLPLPYISAYRFKSDSVKILHIHHSAQAWR